MDRDATHKRRGAAVTSTLIRWWHQSTITEILWVGILAVGLMSSAVWLFRDLGFSAPSREATLRVNINTASIDELQTLPGIGPAIASLIVAARPYASVEELARVKGIGPASVESLRPFVTVSGDTGPIGD